MHGSDSVGDESSAPVDLVGSWGVPLFLGRVEHRVFLRPLAHVVMLVVAERRTPRHVQIFSFRSYIGL